MKITNSFCTGCGVCFLQCPTKCITMKENKIGEITPVVNSRECIKCNKCKNSCPQNNLVPAVYPQKCYVAYSKDENDWKFSASGGVATVFARSQLGKKDSFYGCDYTITGELKHFCAVNDSDIERMATSKYSQSSAFECFNEIREKLLKNQNVVFVGTPCQVAGLKRFLSLNYENLTTVDLVCHGTPPTKYLFEYIRHLNVSQPDKIRFRGEFDQQLSIYKDGELKYLKPWKQDVYFAAFYDNCISRNSCYFCNYAQPFRVSDITIGDFWGIGELKHINKCSNRPSLILINTEKGYGFFKGVENELYYEERDVDEGIAGNGRLNLYPQKNFRATIFQFLYPITGFFVAAWFALKFRAFSKRLSHIFKRINRFFKRIKKTIIKRIK